MLARLTGKLLWGTAKFTVKHVVVPIAITAATAIVLDEISKRLREGGHGGKAGNAASKKGPEPVIRPER